MREIILASASPRRRELLSLSPLPFTIEPAKGTEPPVDPTLSPEENVLRLAALKAEEVAARHPEALVIGCDTVVAVDGDILGKPIDEEDAARMLRALSGREHAVYTGVCLLSPEGGERFCERTAVRFRSLSAQEIAWYVSTGEPLDKAGAYGIQERAAMFIEGIDGDYANVVGLPLCRLMQALSSMI